MNEVYVTAEGLEELRKRLDYLVNIKRSECAEQIKIARGFGDLSENAEYDAAKEAQGFVEQEIKELDEKIQHAVVIEKDGNRHRVSMGDTVTVLDVEFNEEAVYHIVGTTEANAEVNKISNESPLGAALLGRKIGETVEVTVPSGAKIKYKILSNK